MAKLIPLGQTFNDLKNGEQVGVTRVRLATASDHVVFPNPIKDAAVLGETEAESAALGFYLGGGSKPNVFNIDNGSAGQEVLITTRHGGMINFGTE